MKLASIARTVGLAAAGVFCATVVLAGVSSAVSAKDSVNISNFSWPGYSWLFVAKEKNLAPDLEINIEIIEDPLQSFSMIASGRLDATLSTAEFGPIATEQEMPFKTVGFNNYSCGIDRIVLHPDITDPQQLKGERIAVMEGGLSHIFMGLWLEKNGVSHDEVEFVNLIMDDAAAAMIGGDVMAGEFWEPYGSQVLDNLEGSWAAASTDEPFFKQSGFLSDAIFFSDDLIDNRRDVAVKLLKALFDGQAYWQANPEEANQIIAEQMQFDLEDVKSILGTDAGYCAHGLYAGTFMTAARFCGAAPGEPGHRMANGGITGSWSLINEWWIKLGLMESEVPPENGLDCSLLKELYDSGYRGAETPAEAFD